MKFYLEAFAHIPRWRGIVEAAESILQDINVSRRLWGEACGLLGRENAALAILIIERGVDRTPETEFPPIANPEAYLRAMMDRAKSGKLNLQRSIFAISRGAAG